MNDALATKIVQTLHEGAHPQDLPTRLGCTPEALEGRLRRLHDEGIVQWRIDVCPHHLGLHHEVVVEGTPGHATSPRILRGLATRVGRVQAIAQGRVRFNVRAGDPEEAEAHALELARDAGLDEITCHLVVATYANR